MFSRPIPPLRKVGNGQILSFDLINSINGRTEYAADLLQKNRLIAGSNISLSQNANGTIISSSLVSGAIPAPEVVPYRIVGSSSAGYYIYDPSKNTLEFLDSGYNPSGIKGNLISGTINLGIGYGNRAFLYNGTTYTTYQHPNADTINGTSGYHLYDNFICGNYFAGNNNSQGYFLNINTGVFTDFNYGDPYTETYIFGIYKNYLCGVAYGLSIDISWFFNGSNFIILRQYPPFNPNLAFVEPQSVSENYVVGYADILTDAGYQSRGYIYNISTEQFLLKLYPEATSTLFFDIYNENLIVGNAFINGLNRAIMYDITKDEFSLIQSPDPNVTLNFAKGIG